MVILSELAAKLQELVQCLRKLTITWSFVSLNLSSSVFLFRLVVTGTRSRSTDNGQIFIATRYILSVQKSAPDPYCMSYVSQKSKSASRLTKCLEKLARTFALQHPGSARFNPIIFRDHCKEIFESRSRNVDPSRYL